MDGGVQVGNWSDDNAGQIEVSAHVDAMINSVVTVKLSDRRCVVITLRVQWCHFHMFSRTRSEVSHLSTCNVAAVLAHSPRHDSLQICSICGATLSPFLYVFVVSDLFVWLCAVFVTHSDFSWRLVAGEGWISIEFDYYYPHVLCRSLLLSVSSTFVPLALRASIFQRQWGASQTEASAGVLEYG